MTTSSIPTPYAALIAEEQAKPDEERSLTAITAYVLAEEAYRRGVADERARAAKLVEALSDLMDWQNGPPLPSYEEGWTTAMSNARAALAEYQGKE